MGISRIHFTTDATEYSENTDFDVALLYERFTVMPDMQRLHAIASGRVQGVGYRNFVWKYAQKTPVCGYVKNLQNGTVEVIAEGNDDDLQALLRTMRKGPMLARVDDVSQQYSPATGEFDGFSVRY